MSPCSSRYLLILLFLFGLLAVLACDWSIDYGIVCLYTADSGVLAVRNEEYNGVPETALGFVSHDGGLTWRPGWLERFPSDLSAKCSHAKPTLLVDPRDERVRYRFTSEHAVERSEDGGQTWVRELDAVLGEAEAAYYNKTRSPLATQTYPEPQDAVIDERTGNLIVALGQAGVAVRTADGQWQHISLGPYSYVPLDAGKVAALLTGELLLALVVIFLIIETSFLIATGLRWWAVILGILLWLLWLFLLYLAPASDAFFFPLSGSDASLLDELFYLFIVSALLLSSHALYRLSRVAWRAVFIVSLGGLLGGLLFYAMYWLWAWVKIPTYGRASLYALLLVFATIIATAYFINREIDRETLAQPQSELSVEIDDVAKDQHGN
jgi:hypothetical protein